MIKNKLADNNSDYSLVILTTSASKFDASVFSANEIKYVKDELKNKKSLVAVNQYNRMVYVCLLENKSKEQSLYMESCRKAGHQMTALLNKTNVKSVLIEARGLRQEALCFTEGLALANYQFRKYKTSGNNNSLEVIALHSNKLTDKDLLWLNIILRQRSCQTKWLSWANRPV